MGVVRDSQPRLVLLINGIFGDSRSFCRDLGSWGFYAGHAHPLSCEHGAHVPAWMFCVVGVCMPVLPAGASPVPGFTSVAGVMHPRRFGSVIRVAGLLRANRRFGRRRVIVRLLSRHRVMARKPPGSGGFAWPGARVLRSPRYAVGV